MSRLVEASMRGNVLPMIRRVVIRLWGMLCRWMSDDGDQVYLSGYPGPEFHEKPASFVTKPAFKVKDYSQEYAEALARYQALLAKDAESKARMRAAFDETDRIMQEIKKLLDERTERDRIRKETINAIKEANEVDGEGRGQEAEGNQQGLSQDGQGAGRDGGDLL